jgi:uncharacterized membrane protein
MKGPSELTQDDTFGILALLILGAGFVGMFAGFPYFFLIWILGYAVVLPILGILLYETDTDSEMTEDEQSTDSLADPLTSLRDRYARGDLTDDEFESKLERLLETESTETAVERRELEREAE